jgi:hypothetical protein
LATAGAALALAITSPALAQYADEFGDVTFELTVPANTRAELYLGREPTLLLICLVDGPRATIDISSERASRAVLERDECVLVSEREVYATVPAGDAAATLTVRVILRQR